MESSEPKATCRPETPWQAVLSDPRCPTLALCSQCLQSFHPLPKSGEKTLFWPRDGKMGTTHEE